MSDSLYDAKLRDIIRPKAKGILQFGDSKCDRIGRSLNRSECASDKVRRLEDVNKSELTLKEK
jgi:hypothetical protein